MMCDDLVYLLWLRYKNYIARSINDSSTLQFYAPRGISQDADFNSFNHFYSVQLNIAQLKKGIENAHMKIQ